MKVVVVNGVCGSGKDSFESYVAAYAKLNGYIIDKTSMVTYVKKCAEKCGWAGGKTNADRKFLASLKDILEEWNDSPFEDVHKFLLTAAKDGKYLTFVDAREGKDIDRIKEHWPDTTTVLVKNDNVRPPQGNHADENVNDYFYDWVIDNSSSLEDLRLAAEVWFEKILEEGELV